MRPYSDNGAAYRSNYLGLVCAKLDITLVHSRPHAPHGREKIERFFRTVRMQLLPVLTTEDRRSLQALNRRLWTWIGMTVCEALNERIVVRYQATRGLPRKVNLLAHHALLAGAVAKAKSTSVEHVQTALQETV